MAINFTVAKILQYSLSIILYCLLATPAVAQTIASSRITTNGTIQAIVTKGDTTFLGGLFSKSGYNTGASALLSTSSDIPTEGFPQIIGTVLSSIPDGQGGWYVAGNFNKIGDTERRNLAHILPDKTVDPEFNISVNSAVNTLAISGNVLFLGGNFTQVGNQTLNKLAAINTTDSQVMEWDPNLEGNRIKAMVISDNTIYVGGSFSKVDGQDRNSLAAIDATSGRVKPWNPRPDTQINVVHCMAIHDDKIFIGGIFGKMGGQTRNGMAAVDAVSGNATSFNAGLPVSANISAIAVHGSIVFVGGRALLNGSLRAFETSTGKIVDSFNPGLEAEVGLPEIHTILVNSNVIFVGGYFNKIGGQPRNGIAALDASSGEARTWNPQPGKLKNTYTIALDDNSILIGGNFDYLKEEVRNNLLALDASSNKLLPWNPNVDQSVKALALDGDVLYIGGSFNKVGDQPRSRIAAVNVNTGETLNWNPNADGEVSTMAVNNNIVYIGGKFKNIGGQARSCIAALNKSSGTVTAWNPGADNSVHTIATDDGIIFAGGNFRNIGGQGRNYVAALDAATGAATAWNPNVNGTVNAIKINQAAVYIGGNFFQVGGQARRSVAAISRSSGLAERFDANVTSGVVSNMVLKNNYLIIGGSFTKLVGETSCKNLSILNAVTGNDLNNIDLCYDFGQLGTVHSLSLQSNHLHLGGAFQSINDFDTGPYAMIDFPEDYFEISGIELSAKTALNSDTDFKLTVTGSGFNQNTRVIFSKAGENNIEAKGTNVLNSNLLEATFDFKGATPGSWDVLIMDDNTVVATLSNGFTLLERTTIPFGEWFPFSVKPNELLPLLANLPQVDDLFVLIRTSRYGTYNVSLSKIDGGLIATSSDISDLDIHLKNVEEGLYTVEILDAYGRDFQIKLTDNLDSLSLGNWSKGQILRPGGHDWKQIDIKGNFQKLYFQTEGYGLHSTLEIFSGSLGAKAPGKYWKIFDKEGYHLMDSISNPPPGRYYIRYMDSAVLHKTDQTREYLVYVNGTPSMDSPLDLSITGLSSYSGGQGPVTIEISGTGLSSDNIVKLIRDGHDEIISTSIVADSNSRILKVSFDLSNTALGEWDLVVTNHAGKSTVAPHKFSVEEVSDQNVWVELLGRSQIRVGRPHVLIIKYGNQANVNLSDVMVYLKLPKELLYDVGTPMLFNYKDQQPDKRDINYFLIPELPAHYTGEFAIILYSDKDLGNNLIEAGVINYPKGFPNERVGERLSSGLNIVITETSLKPGMTVYQKFRPLAVVPLVGPYTPATDWPAHDGIYVEEEVNGQKKGFVVEYLDDSRIHKVPFTDKDWKTRDGGSYIGAGYPNNWTPEKGEVVAKNALDEYYATLPPEIFEADDPIKGTKKGDPYWGKGTLDWKRYLALPYEEGTSNCNTFVEEIYRKSGVPYNPTLTPSEKYKTNNKVETSDNEKSEPEGNEVPLWNGPDIRERLDLDKIDKLLGPYSKPLSKIILELIQSTTPEDKYGLAGYDPDNTRLSDLNRYIAESPTFEYRIDYWNKPDATAPAAEVFIRDTLDADFDLASLNFTEVGFLKWRATLDGGPYFNITIDMRPDENYLVNVEGQVDPLTREIYWVHRTLDPTTGELPEDPTAGYLPPIDSTGYQVGWVNYTIKPIEGLPSGTVFSNQAHVNFDGVGPWGPAPAYGPYINTLDNEAPVSEVSMLPASVDTTFVVQWSGEDTGSGINRFSIYVSEDDGPYTLWMDTTGTSAEFAGKNGQQYAFYSIARDNVGNTEEPPLSADAITAVNTVTGLPSEKLADLIHLFPNPASTQLQIEMPSQIKLLNIQAFNFIGKKFGSYDFVKSRQEKIQTISVRHLPKGIYIFHLNTNKGSFYKKIVIN